MIGMFLNSAFSDGTDLASLENVVRGFQRFGRVNKESLAELFVTLFIKVIFSFPFLLFASHTAPASNKVMKSCHSIDPWDLHTCPSFIYVHEDGIAWKMTKSSVLVCRVQDKSTINFNFIQKKYIVWDIFIMTTQPVIITCATSSHFHHWSHLNRIPAVLIS